MPRRPITRRAAPPRRVEFHRAKTVLFSRPGEVRQWSVPGLDGACLFFTEEFLATTFRDAGCPPALRSGE